MLTACGFRLQAVENYPKLLGRTYIEAPDRYSVFYRQLYSKLERGGIIIVSSPIDSTAVIRIEKDITGQQVLTISSRNVPTEYDVYYSVTYSVLVDGKVILPSRTLSFSQDYAYDETRILGKAREEMRIRESVAAELVRLINQELSRLGN
ncbi:MAG: LPS assembly lipoprotein LptE [Pseudomonadota bacterium]|nr:LPS assembly lipoprotein LptE [Pseudomonadota bacterium]